MNQKSKTFRETMQTLSKNKRAVNRVSPYKARQFIQLFKDGVCPKEIANRWGDSFATVARVLQGEGLLNSTKDYTLKRSSKDEE